MVARRNGKENAGAESLVETALTSRIFDGDHGERTNRTHEEITGNTSLEVGRNLR
jgi:hypothetical protein